MLSLGSITCAKMVSKQSKMIEKRNPISSFFQRNQRRGSQQEFWMEIDSAQRKLLKITFSSNSRTKFATSWTIHTCIIIKLVVLGIPRPPNNYPPTLEAQLFWAQATEDTDFVKRWKYQTFVENFGENWIEVGVEERGGRQPGNSTPASLFTSHHHCHHHHHHHHHCHHRHVCHHQHRCHHRQILRVRAVRNPWWSF